MCDAENSQALQQGMNFRLNPHYSVILMSQRSNAPYVDKIEQDGITIEYEGHDIPKIPPIQIPKNENQIGRLPSGKLTQNGKFAEAVQKIKSGSTPELVKVYEKIIPGIWSLKGFFDLVDYKIVHDGRRKVFRFFLKLSDNQSIDSKRIPIELSHTRLIPSQVKKEVWKRDGGKCVMCGATDNLHFDHDLPFSKGGTSLSIKNVKLLCMKHNLSKSDKIE